jgi:hypothetical protein
MVDPFTGDDRIHGAGVHIRLSGQRGHAVHPIAELLPPLMFEQAALDFGQGQDRWHGRILLPPLPARNSLLLMLGFGASGGGVGFGRVIIGHGFEIL